MPRQQDGLRQLEACCAKWSEKRWERVLRWNLSRIQGSAALGYACRNAVSALNVVQEVQQLSDVKVRK